MSRRRALMASVLLGAGLVVAATMAPGLSGAAAPPSTGRGEGFQFKTLLDTGFCMDIDESGSQPRAIVSTCTAVASQRFTLSDGADGYNLMIDSRGRCLSRGPKLSKDFFTVAVAPCTYRANERWSLLALGQFTQANANRCLVIPRAASGASVNVVPCQTVDSQRWQLSQ